MKNMGVGTGVRYPDGRRISVYACAPLMRPLLHKRFVLVDEGNAHLLSGVLPTAS